MTLFSVRSAADPGPLRQVSVVDTAAWLTFCIISLHLAFLWPYSIVFPGQRANFFSGLLCAATLLAALVVALIRPVRATKSEFLVTLGLLFLAVFSGCVSLSPHDSSSRVAILVASGLGGFWCSRILLNSFSRQRLFGWLCTAGLAGIIVLSLWHYPDTGRVDYFLYARSHPLIQMLILLAVGPMALVSGKKPWMSVIGMLILVFTYITLYLIGVDDTRSAVLIPMAMLGVLAVLAAFGSRLVPAALVLLLVVSAVTAHFAVHTSHRSLLQYQEYRVETYPFSWHVAKKYPAFGIGLRSPRTDFVKDYQVNHPNYPENVFAREVNYLVTSENTFLTFMVGLGIPFFLLYGIALLVLLWRLIRLIARPPETWVFHPLVLFLPIAGSILHSLTTDALLYPQINWYFHVLLGLIPYPAASAHEVSLNWKTVCFRAVAAVGVAAVGIVLGTHQGFQLEGAPGRVLGLSGIHSAPSSAGLPRGGGTAVGSGSIPPPTGESSSVPGEESASAPATTTARSQEASPVRDAPCSLVVNVEDYKGSPVSWQVMLILDNSGSMAREDHPWLPRRLTAAATFVELLGRHLPDNAQLAMRDFSGAISGRKDGREVPFRVSRRASSWTTGPIRIPPGDDHSSRGSGRNNLCAAALHSIAADFSEREDVVWRLAIVTDGQSPCSWNRVVKAIGGESLSPRIRIDVIAVGMAHAVEPTYRNLVESSGGVFLTAESPSQLDAVVGRYVQELPLLYPAPVEVKSFQGRFRVLPKEKRELPPGKYWIVLPPMEGLSPAHRKVPEPIKLLPGETRVLTLSVEDGVPTIR